MKSTGKIWFINLSVLSCLIIACVTINIYFPAEKVESTAKEIVDDIRGPAENGETGFLMNLKNYSFKMEDLSKLFCTAAHAAEEVREVSNPTIRALKERMKSRYAQMKPYYQKGLLKEGDDGFVSIKNTSGLGLKEKRDLQNLVTADNEDRRSLYQEVAKALKIDPGQIDRIAEIFAKEWQSTVR